MIIVWGVVLSAQTITVTSPIGGTVFCKGQTVSIHWVQTGVTDPMVRLRLRTSPGDGLALLIVEGIPIAPGSFAWTIPNSVIPGTYRIRVRSTPDGLTDGPVSGDSALFTISACPPPPVGSITVTSPASGVVWQKGSTYSINWTHAGVTDPMVRIRLRNSPSDGLALQIVEGVPKTPGSYSWSIPDSVVSGTYRIRVRSTPDGLTDGPVVGDSAIFTIGAPIRFEMTPLIAPVDLAVTDIRYVFSRGGQLVARVRCVGVNSIDKDVEFRLQLPGTRENRLVTHRISLARNAEMDVYLRGLNQSDIPNPGLIVRVTADPNERLSDPDRSNNTLEKRLGILDLSCQTPFGDLEVSRMYLQGGEDYRVKFKIRVRHNLTQPVNRIHVRYAMMDVVGPTETLVIESLAPGEEWVHQVNLTFGKEGRPRSKRPRLRSGTTYRFQVMLLDPTNSFFDVNPRNNTDTLAFRIPD